MSTILSIETATSSGSVSLHKSGHLIGLQQYNIEKSHSSLLHVLIEQLLNNSGISKNDLDAIAVSAGPGSYTGLRIGVSTAKGLCYALDKPLISINTLECMAYQVASVAHENSLLCPMIDARRQEVYCMIVANDMKIIQVTEPLIIDELSFQEKLDKKKIFFFGDGSDKCHEIITHLNGVFIKIIIPSAKEIGILAGDKFDKEQFENLAYYEPFYLKEFRIIKSKKKLF